MSDLNFFSQNEIDLLVEAKKNKNYIHIKPNSSEIKQVMNLQKLNEMMSRHDSWNVSNFKLVLDRKPIDFHKIIDFIEYNLSKEISNQILVRYLNKYMLKNFKLNHPTFGKNMIEIINVNEDFSLNIKIEDEIKKIFFGELV